MPFAINIERDEDIAALTANDIERAIDERNQSLHEIFAQAGANLDHTKVTAVSVRDGAELAQQIRHRNEEITKLAKRRDELAEIEKIRRQTEERRNEPSGPDPRQFAPGSGPSPTQPVRQMQNLGHLVTRNERYAAWAQEGAPSGTGLSFSFDKMRPSDVLASAAYVRTLRNTLFETTAGWAPESIRVPGLVVEAVTRPLQLLDIIPLAETSMEKVVYMEETTRTHAAAEKAEGAAYAESTFVLTEKESSVRKITDSIPVTDEQLADVAQVESYLNSRLVFGLRQRLDSQVLVGNGTAPNLRGIKNVAGIQTQALGGDNRPDAFFKAMTKIRVTGRAMPTHHLVHPDDWQEIRLLKTTDGAYLWGPPSEAGPERMWGLPVVQQDADAAGTGYVGSFQPAWISLFERAGVDVQVGFIGDQFVQGKRTIRADMRFAFVVFRPAAFCTVTGI